MYDNASDEMSGNGHAVRLANRIELNCDRFTTSRAILDALGEVSQDLLVVLQLSPNAGISARRAIQDAYSLLKPRVRGVRVLALVPSDTDGTDVFRDGPNSLHHLLDLCQDLPGLGKDLIWSVELTSDIVWRLDSIFSVAAMKGARVVPVPSSFLMPPDAQLFAWDFVTYFLLEETRSLYGPKALAYFQMLQSALYANQLTASPDGVSGTALTEMLAEDEAAQDSASGPSLGEFAQLASEGLRAHLGALPPGAGKASNLPASFDTAVLVGAYGGEHVGDIAILGGVLLRMHAQFGLRDAVLMTQRPNHTQHLIGNLDTPVNIRVEEYTFGNIAKHLKTHQALIHAGGPLTDIPKQLVRHLYAAGMARRQRKPYLIEGIGPTTFKRTASRVTARQLVKLADRLIVRTQDDAKRPVIEGLDIGVTHCPAFDYLATRGPELTRLVPGELEQIDTLLKGSEGRPIIGINIRPINDLFTPEAAGRSKASFTREVEDRMERNLAAGLAAYAAASEKDPVFVFFPMNAIQFGKSDNRSAFQIARHLPPHIDARIWPVDASLDAVVALVRRCDTVISMRFHATIFALSQNCPPIGIDYRIGMKYKVTAVMEDAGEADFCCRIDEVESDWIVDKITQRLAARAQK